MNGHRDWRVFTNLANLTSVLARFDNASGSEQAHPRLSRVVERQSLLFDQLDPHLGAAVQHPAEWHDKAWHSDKFVGGGYAALPVPGTREGFYPVAHSPVGDIHWAGTETAAEHGGYIEGAIESAHRVAAEVGGDDR
ncbi:FAD-dependent oxidoreductase [Gordonia sp. NPDC003429]